MPNPDYRYLACNALTNAVIDELPLRDVNFSRVINDAGGFSGGVPLDGQSANRCAQLIAAAEPAQISIYVQRNQSYVWGGVLTAHSFDGDSGILAIEAAEWGSWLDDRYFVSGTTYNQDIATLATTIVTAVFADHGPPLLTSTVTAGLTVSMPFKTYEKHQASELVKTLAVMNPGFDYGFDAVANASGNPVIQWTVQKRRGVSYITSGLVLDYPGAAITSLGIKKDGKRFATSIIGTGAGNGATQLQTEVQTGAVGYVKVQKVVNNKDLTTTSQLRAFATSAATAYGDGNPPVTPSVTALGSATIGAGIGVGDELTIAIPKFLPDGKTIACPYYPSGAQLPVRILAMKVTPPTDNAPELCDLTLGDVL